MRLDSAFLVCCTTFLIGGVTPARAKSPPAAKAAPDAAVKAGQGWSRTAPGVWVYQLDRNQVPNRSLGTPFVGSRGEQRIDLPAGARKAQVKTLRVCYTSAGTGTWKLLADDQGKPGSRVLAEIPFKILPTQTTAEGKDAPRWIDHPVTKALVSGSFWAVFSGGAEVCALTDAGAQARLFYRGKPERTALPVEHLPYVRVILQDVDGR